MNNNNIEAGVGCRVQGIVQCSVVEARTKKVLRTYPKQKNLILNQGLNQYCGRTIAGWPGGFTYACAGDGTTPTQTDSGLTTADSVGTTVTLVGGAFVFTNTATDAGKVIKWDSGQEAFILTVTSPTQVVVRETQTIPAGEFTVYLTNQTKMGGGIGVGNSTSDIKRTATYVSGVGDCGTTFTSPHIVEIKRTYDFSAEAGGVTYTEIGMAPTATVDLPNLFMRLLLVIPVPLIAGQQLRVVYTLIVTWTPSVATNVTPFDVPGWPVAPALTTNGAMAYEFLSVSGVTTSGNSTAGADRIDPGQVERVNITSNNSALAAVPHQVGNDIKPILSTQGPGYLAYVADSFECISQNTFAPNVAISTSVWSFFLGYWTPGFGYNNDRSFFRVRFNEAQTKDSLHKLTIRFKWVASRVLS